MMESWAVSSRLTMNGKSAGYSLGPLNSRHPGEEKRPSKPQKWASAARAGGGVPAAIYHLSAGRMREPPNRCFAYSVVARQLGHGLALAVALGALAPLARI
jgi:hypothetical protein